MEGVEIIQRQIIINRRKFLADVILIVVLVLIFAYVFYEIESFKLLGKDVCKLCEEKTGRTCIGVLKP